MASDLTVQNLNVNSVNGKAWGSEFFGVDQTWQDVTASRVNSTTYTNSTGKPIMVHISGGTNSSTQGVSRITINGVICSGGSTSMQTVYDIQWFSDSIIIPNGATYSISFYFATTARWFELR